MFDFLAEKFSSIFTKIAGNKVITEQNIADSISKLHDALIDADVPYDVVQDFTQQLKQEALGAQLLKSLNPAEYFMKLVYDRLIVFLADGKSDSDFAFSIPSTIMLLGLQGSGKTTTIARLAQFVVHQAASRGKKRKIMIASVDFYRPAAIEQLAILTKKIESNGSEIIFYEAESEDPVAASLEISAKAKELSCDLLFLDTAGRLHVDQAMLLELKKIDSLLKPKYKILVLDSMTGQESVSVAKAFFDLIDFTGAVLTKLDSDTRAGAAFAFRYLLKRPILFVGTGEKIGDLEKFIPDRIASRILGMGDIQSLLEKANQKIKKSDQDQLYNAVSKGKLTLLDFANQMDMMSKMGSLSSLLKYMPGASMMKISPEMIEKGEKEIKVFKAIMSSMTRKELLVPTLLNSSRKNRISRGAGVSLKDVDMLLSRFEQSQQIAKTFKKIGGFRNY